MAYTKTEWKDQVVENPRTYSMRDNGDNTVTLLDAFGTVTELGTPVNAVNMNHIEDGIKEVDNTAVHKTGNEKITGTKTFEGNNRIVVLQNSTVTYNTAPSSDTFTDLSFRDKNGDEMAALEHVRYPNNSSAFRLLVKGVDGNWSTSLEVGKKANGDVYTKANTPSSSDNSQQIATTAFVQTAVNTRATQADINLAVSNVLSALYPVGSLYITTNNSATCPLASLISGSKWSLVAADKALWTSNRNGNTTIAAGLPNITGSIDKIDDTMTCTGAFYMSNRGSEWNVAGESGSDRRTANFDASRSNSIYGKSNTVQPPAYRVNVWRRTA